VSASIEKHIAHREAMVRLVERYDDSGFTRRPFIRQDGIPRSKLNDWGQRYRRHQRVGQAQEASARFIPLQPESRSALQGCEQPPLVELRFGAGMIRRIYRSDTPWLP